MVTNNSKFDMDNNNFKNVSLYEDIDHDLNFYEETSQNSKRTFNLKTLIKNDFYFYMLI